MTEYKVLHKTMNYYVSWMMVHVPAIKVKLNDYTLV